MSNLFDRSRWAPHEGNNISWYDIMQVCENGHVITGMFLKYPQHTKARCPKCGAKTITKCPACNADIQGHYHIPGVASSSKKEPEACCIACGEPFPWTTQQQQSKAIASEGKKDLALTNRVFIVHGHDDEMKQFTARTLMKLGLEPIILHEMPSGSRTVIEKFEKNADVGFAVILLSPDDKAYPVTSTAKDARPRARQNVILELGYFAGKLGRDRVFVLKKGDDLEVPSDLGGVVYVPYDPTSHWRFELVKELQAVGYDIDANKLIR